ncbi:MAG: hypothetical protein V3V80_00325, partial [Dehalococcoidia bacterium]
QPTIRLSSTPHKATRLMAINSIPLPSFIAFLPSLSYNRTWAYCSQPICNPAGAVRSSAHRF